MSNYEYILDEFDGIVIGAGHAGCEAALALARLGKRTAIFCLSLDTIANMPCNPCIGGSAKGQLVSEIDALGGEMGKAADKTMLQSRVLNRGKGAAVHALRVQSDRMAYHSYMKNALEKQIGVEIKQDEVTDVLVENGKVYGVKTKNGATYLGKAVIITTGTYLGGKIFIGDANYESGADGVMAAKKLTESLKSIGIETRRFKTGTPARVHKRSINFDVLEKQSGEEPIFPFSFDNEYELQNKTDCYITYTNKRTHDIILENIHRSPLYGGEIEGIGPRYCPSLEDKVMRFRDKERHQLFIEPMGIDTDEYYLQGMSSSLPLDVQLKFYRTIKGLENVEIMRPAYAIEYDCVDPTELYGTLEFKKIENLYGAGQFNGTSGYEEAAAQGLIAGINASRKMDGKTELILERSSSYIGTLIDDLVTKGCLDPYRMMTSRSEYRLLLRQDNAPERLSEIGHEYGLLTDERYNKYLEIQRNVDRLVELIEKTSIKPCSELINVLTEKKTSPITQSVKAVELLKRPQISLKDIERFMEISEFNDDVKNKAEIKIKYSGYIKTQLEQVAASKKLDDKLLPQNTDYKSISGLRIEAAEKLEKFKPMNIGQAGRISGVNPADISVLLIWLAANRGKDDV